MSINESSHSKINSDLVSCPYCKKPVIVCKYENHFMENKCNFCNRIFSIKNDYIYRDP